MFYLGLRLTLVPQCTKFSETSSNNSSDIKRKPFQMALNDLRNFENTVKVTRFELGLCLAMGVICTEFGESSSNRYWAEITLNDLRDLENEVKVTRFNLGLGLVLLPLQWCSQNFMTARQMTHQHFQSETFMGHVFSGGWWFLIQWN